MSLFRFKKFSVHNDRSALKIGTDAVLLGSMMSLDGSERRLLDIGTGTGVIALMAAQRMDELAPAENETFPWQITAIDIDSASAEEAGQSAAESPWARNLSVVNASLREFAARPDEAPFDLIFSNPPYFDDSLCNPDKRESRARHTESLSYRDICSYSAKSLRPGGHLAMILPSEACEAVRRSAVSFGLKPARIVFIRTSAKKAPKRIIVEFVRENGGCPKTGPGAWARQEEIVMTDGGEFTSEYRKIVSPFLLSL